jgi:uncharacterized protein YjbI with pentapeptide repeats
MANQEQLSILKQGMDTWNKWRDTNPNAGIDLSDANLSMMEFVHANFKSADLTRTNFRASNVSKTDFTNTNLWGANFSRADLSGAILSHSDLDEANMSGAIVSGCNFARAALDATILGGLDLSEAIGLEAAEHIGPSRVSTDTLALSKGKIPDAFLRGCGLSDWEIAQANLYNPELSNDEISNLQYKIHDLRAGQAVQFSPLFISYSRADGEFVDRIGDALTKKGVRYWRDTHEMKAGRIEKQIDRAISQNPTVLMVLSENSIKSDWVEHEVRVARALEKETGRDVMCPIELDRGWRNGPWPQRIIEQIREYNVLDFSGWRDNGKFEDMFGRLIGGLELFYKG